MYNNYFKNKIALITGGGSGIGRGLCRQLDAAGATAICTDINLTHATETISMLSSKAEVRLLDVTDDSDIAGVIEDIVKKHGRLDLIFNNAGLAISGELRDISMTDWRKLMDVNFYGVLYGSQAAYQVMLKQGNGQIVNIASAAGLVDDLALLAPYSVSKHAVVNYTHILRLEAEELGIKANVVCPGFISTSIGENATDANAKPGWRQKSKDMVAKGVTVESAANSILKGVAANKRNIVFPGETRAINGFAAMFGGLFRRGMKRSIKDFRQNYRIND